MRNLEIEYRETALTENIVGRCLQKAQERFPGTDIAFCGYEDRWEDCLSGYTNKDGTELVFILQFNVGMNTRAVEIRIGMQKEQE